MRLPECHMFEQRQLRLVAAGLATSGWLAALLGPWLPWLAPGSAALRFNLLELAEWITRLPGIREESLAPSRLQFLALLAGLALLGGLIAGQCLSEPAALRRLVLAAGAFHALLIFPGYPFILDSLSDPVARSQALLGLGALAGMAAAFRAASRLSPAVVGGGVSALGLATLALAWGSWRLASREFATLLPEMGSPGPGLYLFLSGGLLVTVAGPAAGGGRGRD